MKNLDWIPIIVVIIFLLLVLLGFAAAIKDIFFN